MNAITAPVPAVLPPIALVALALPPLGPAIASAQEVGVLTEGLCAACSIDFTPDVLLGADGESVIGIAMDIERLSDGRFVMTFADARYEFTVFSADGSAFQRVGRAGQGPGEYEEAVFVREHEEEFFVFDQERRRVTVLDRDFKAVRTWVVPCLFCAAWDMDVLSGGEVVLNYLQPGDPEQPSFGAEEGFVIHILDGDGERLRSLDRIRIPVSGMARLLDIEEGGSVLAADPDLYRFDRWDPQTGERLRTYLREADWVTDGTWGPAGPDRAPDTSIGGMHLDGEGRLWVYVSRAAPDWRDHLIRRGGGPEARYRYGPGSYEGVMEVLDLESGRVLVSQVLDSELLGGVAWHFFAPGWMAVYHEDRLPQFRMWRLTLKGLE